MEEIIFYPIAGYPDYQISKCGKIKSLSRFVMRAKGLSNLKEKLLKPQKSYCPKRKNIYWQVRLIEKPCGPSKMKRIHRLIAETFIQNPGNKPCVNHINGITTDNSIENLEWCTYSENAQHAVDIGLTKADYWKGKEGPNCPVKPILKIDINGNVIAEYNRLKDVPVTTKDNVSKCCRGKMKLYLGYKWVYKEDFFK